VVGLAQESPPDLAFDIACATGLLTQHLRGFVIGLDQSPSMVGIAQSRLPGGVAIVGDGLNLVVATMASTG
jgi:SAM-dependent methyltransferase